MSFEFGELWMKERAAGLGRLAGSRLSGRVPIRQALVDELLRRWRKPTTLETVDVCILADNLLQISARINVLGFRKRLDTTVRIAPAVQLHGRQTLHLFFVKSTLLTTIASVITPLLGGIVSITRDTVAIDLGAAFARARMDDLLPHVRAAAIEGQDGVLWLNLEVEVGSSSTTLAGAPLTPSERRATWNAEEIVSTFAGADLEATLRIDESLATEIIQVLFGKMQQHRAVDAAAPAGRSFAQAIEPPRIRFESQLMIVETRVRL